jgi:hypothetical protein
MKDTLKPEPNISVKLRPNNLTLKMEVQHLTETSLTRISE